MRSCGPAGLSDPCDDLSLFDTLSLRDQDLREVKVHGQQPQPMVNDETLAAEKLVTREDDPSLIGRINRGAFRGVNINAGMRTPWLAIDNPPETKVIINNPLSRSNEISIPERTRRRDVPDLVNLLFLTIDPLQGLFIQIHLLLREGQVLCPEVFRCHLNLKVLFDDSFPFILKREGKGIALRIRIQVNPNQRDVDISFRIAIETDCFIKEGAGYPVNPWPGLYSDQENISLLYDLGGKA